MRCIFKEKVNLCCKVQELSLATCMCTLHAYLYYMYTFMYAYIYMCCGTYCTCTCTFCQGSPYIHTVYIIHVAHKTSHVIHVCMYVYCMYVYVCVWVVCILCIHTMYAYLRCTCVHVLHVLHNTSRDLGTFDGAK